MELHQLWKIARRRWWLIALPSLAAFAYAAFLYTRSAPAVGYTTAIRFTAAEPPEGEVTGYEDSSYYPWLASEYVVNALTDWVSTGTFAEEVSAALKEQHGVEIGGSALRGSMRADNARSIMTLYLNWGDAEQIEQIASAATYVLQNRSAEYFPQVRAEGLKVVALDSAAIGAVPPPLTSRIDPLIRLALGIAAGVGLAFLIEYLDPALHDRREVEAIGLNVIAEIPRQ